MFGLCHKLISLNIYLIIYKMDYILFINNLIESEEAYESNGKIYQSKKKNYIKHLVSVENSILNFEEGKNIILWEECDDDDDIERFPGDPGPINTPWGFGRFTRNTFHFTNDLLKNF